MGRSPGAPSTSGDTARSAFRTEANQPINPATDNLGTLGGVTASANCINNVGQVAGQAASFASDINAFRVDANQSTMIDLGTLSGSPNSYAWAFGINDKGQVVGESYTTNNFSGFQIIRAFCTAADQPINPTTDDLGTFPGGTSSVAYGINDNGQVVGGANTGGSANAEHAFLYSGGSMQDLGTLPGGKGSEAHAVNNIGQVVGYADTSSGLEDAFLYSGGSMQDLGTLLGATQSEALGINNSGRVVGYATAGADIYGDPINRAFVYIGSGSIEDLNNLISPSSGWTLEEATGINDSGQICGYGIAPDGNTEAFLLTPIPEPSTFVLLAAGAVGLLGFAWRRRRRTA